MNSALVLGAGGVAGIAWEIGVVSGLRQAGVDLGTADLIVGTSAGSVVGTLLAAGVDLTGPDRWPRGGPRVQPDWERGAQVLGLLNAGRDTAEVRAAAGALAVAAQVGPPEAQVEYFERLLPVREWPERPLLITAVDAASGEFVVWTRESGVPLVRAVAASCAVPCVFPTVEINGRRYMDGGVRSVLNSDLAAGADVVAVLAPLAGLRLYGAPEAELDTLRATAKVVLVVPDDDALAAFGPNVLDPSRRAACLAAGVAQGLALAATVRAAWVS